jgi:hypothetical protein
MPAAKDPARLAGNHIGRKLRAPHERQFGVGHQQKLPVLVVEIHPHDRRHHRRVHRQFPPPLLPKGMPAVQRQQNEEVGNLDLEGVGNFAPGHLLQHEQKGIVPGRKAEHCIPGRFSDGVPCPVVFQKYAQGNPSVGRGLAPAVRQSQQDRAVQRPRRPRGSALEKRFLLHLPQMAGPALLFLELALALGIRLAGQQGQAQGDDMGANNAPLDVIPAGTKVFAGEIRQDLGRGLDRPAPPRQNAAHDRMLKFGVQHQAPVKQGLPVPEGDRPPPVLQDFLCDRQLHEPLPVHFPERIKWGNIPIGAENATRISRPELSRLANFSLARTGSQPYAPAPMYFARIGPGEAEFAQRRGKRACPWP